MSYLSFEQPKHFYKKESSQIFLLFHFKYAKLALLVKYVATRILSACLDKDIGFVTTYIFIDIHLLWSFLSNRKNAIRPSTIVIYSRAPNGAQDWQCIFLKIHGMSNFFNTDSTYCKN